MHISNEKTRNEQTSEIQKQEIHKLPLSDQGVCEQGACGQWFCYAGVCMWYCVAWSSHGLMSWSGMSRKVPAAIPSGLSDGPFLQGDVHRVVLTCARCMGLLRTGLLRRRCAVVCYCSPCPPAAMMCSSVCHIAGSQRSRCRNVIFLQAYAQSAVLTYARCPGLVHRSCAAVCCRLA